MKYYLAFIAIVLFLVISVKLIFTATKSPSTKSPTNSAVVKTLPDYASTGAETSVTIDGPVVGNEEHRAIRITVGRNERVIEVLQGYQGQVIRSKTYGNNQSAYDAFLRGLNLYGFTKERVTKYDNSRDVCPVGNHYYYDLKNTGAEDTDKSLWSTSCGLLGTFGSGNGAAIRSLFQRQIPEADYSSLTSDVQLAI